MPLTLGSFTIAASPEWIRAGIIFGSFIAIAVVVAIIWKRVISRWTKRSATMLDDMVFAALRSLAVWGLILVGGYYAVTEISTVRADTVIWPMIGKAFTIGWIALAVLTAIRISNGIAKWRVDQAIVAGPDTVRDVATRVTFVRKLLTGLAIFFGGLYVLSVAGVDTSPLVAGGALGGIVIGIALQDTLSNVFAGFFLNIDRPVKIGDFIKLESGEEGFVEEVGWRYTKVRMWANNIVIIPNNKLSQSIITNYNLPAEPLSVYIYCGVSYDSDLEHVERVAIEVAKHVQETEEGGDVSWEPVVRYKEFGDSAITFVTVLRSVDIGAQYRIHHEFVKGLHKAFKREGIVIPYPIQTILLKKENEQEVLGKDAGSERA